MLYTRPTFTCPASSPKTTDQKWDFAFLNRDEFTAKYSITDAEYDTLEIQS